MSDDSLSGSEEEEFGTDSALPQSNTLAARKRKQEITSPTKKSSKKLKKSRPGGGLFEDVAEEASDDEEELEEDYYDKDKRAEVTNEELSRHERETAKRYEERLKEAEAFKNRSEADIAKALEERHRTRTQDVSKYVGFDATLTDTDLSRNANLPTVTDPKLYAVRCKPGEEQMLIVRLIGKYFDVKRKSLLNQNQKTKTFFTDSGAAKDAVQELGITSAVWPGTKGYIYIESHSELQVKAALFGLRDVFQKLTLIPLKQMTSVMSVTERVENSKDIASRIKDNMFVRLKVYPYKDDLAQVYRIIPSSNKVVMKLVPRIDYEYLKLRQELGHDDENVLKEKKNAKEVPPKAVLSIDKMMEVGLPVEKAVFPVTGDWTDYVPFIDAYFKNGFQLKEMSIRNLLLDGLSPTVEELDEFNVLEKGNEEKIAELLAQVSTNSNDTFGGFAIGDTVIVIEGQLEQVTGKILDIVKAAKTSSSNNTGSTSTKKKQELVIKVQPFHEEIKNEILEFSPSQLKKFFSVGNHVKILGGKYSGETGSIVEIITDNTSGSSRAKIWEAVIFTDIGRKEVTVDVNKIQLSNETSTGRDSLLGYKMYDFVKLHSNSVAVIVNISIDSLTILDSNSRSRVISPNEILSKLNPTKQGASSLFDKNNSSLKLGDVVTVLVGKNKGLEGSVRFMHKNLVFLHSKQLLESAGMMVVFAKSCSLVGGNAISSPAKDNTIKPFNNSNTRNPSQHDKDTRGQGQAAPRRFNPEDDGLKGKTVKIISGKFKGYIGIVVDIRDQQVKVELHTKNKSITIERSKVKPLSSRPSESDIANENGPRSSYASRLSYGSSAPGYVVPTMRTPSFAPATPSHAPSPYHNSHENGDDDDEAVDDRRHVQKIGDDDEEHTFTYKSVATPAMARGYQVKTPALAQHMSVKTPALTVQTPGLTLQTPAIAMQREYSSISAPKTPAFASAYLNPTPAPPTNGFLNKRIRVLNGANKGESGIVQAVDGDEAFVMLESNELAILNLDDIKLTN